QRINDMLGARLATIHNLHYFGWLMNQMRGAIEQAAVEPGAFERWAARFHADRASGVD
ncbi:MAG: tRNA guanosine(34) transglycosylase Tgt, partial [Quisquiliibacterium sp.]